MGVNRKTEMFEICVCLMLLLAALATRLEADGRPDFVIAYSAKMLFDVDAKDAAVAMKLYVDEISKQTGYRGESSPYNSLEELVEKVEQGRIDMIALTTLDYFQAKKRSDLVLSLVPVQGGKTSIKYLLLANANRGYREIGDLRGKTLMLPRGDKTAALYMDTFLMKNRLGEMKSFFSKITEKAKPSQGVLSVFFGQADACVTTDAALKTMTEMNPQLGRALNIIVSSPELVTSITAFRRSMNADVQKKASNFGLQLKSQPRGQQIMLLFKIDGLLPLKEADLASMKDLTDEYDRLMAGKR